LILDNCRSTIVEGLTDDFMSLENLSMINIGITTLKGFPRLPNLTKVSILRAVPESNVWGTWTAMAMLLFFYAWWGLVGYVFHAWLDY